MKAIPLPNGKWWYGYLDDLGVIRVKPYRSDKEIQNLEQLPFVRGIFDPMKANSKHDAQMMIAKWLTEQQVEESKKDSWTKQFMEQ